MARLNKRQRVKQLRQRKAERRAIRAAGGQTAIQSASPVRTAADPLRGRPSGAIDTSLRWYIARTAPRMGERARKALSEIGVVQILPRASEVVVRRGRRVVRNTPLIIRTVFIGVRDDQHLELAKGRSGVTEIVSHPEGEAGASGNIEQLVRRPARLDPKHLQRFMDALAASEISEPAGIRIGQGVMVMTGPFARFPAVVEAILSGDRIKVAVSILGRLSSMEVGVADVLAI